MFAYKKAFIRENNPVSYADQAPDSSLEEQGRARVLSIFDEAVAGGFPCYKITCSGVCNILTESERQLAPKLKGQDLQRSSLRVTLPHTKQIIGVRLELSDTGLPIGSNSLRSKWMTVHR